MVPDRTEEERAAIIRLGQIVQLAGRLLEQIDNIEVARVLDFVRAADNQLYEAVALLLPQDFE
jgi:hypothetical protein